MSGKQPIPGSLHGNQTVIVSPFGFVGSLEAAAAQNSPHIMTLWEIILYIQENLVMHNGRVTPIESLKIWHNQFDGFAAQAYSWLLLHHESKSSEAAIAGISHTRPRLKQQITESLATHERVNRQKHKGKGAVNQAFPDTIKSEVDFWSQEAITKSLNNTTPLISEIADIPRTRQEQAVYIKEMFDALRNTEGIIEKATNSKVEIVKSTSGRVFEDITWVLFREARKFQQGNPDVKPWCTSFMYKEYPTMWARWKDMVGFFCTSKAAVANLIVAHSEKRFAGNPHKEKARKVQNDKGNRNKATRTKTNMDKATALDELRNQAKDKTRAKRSAASQCESFGSSFTAPAPSHPSSVTQPAIKERQNSGLVDEDVCGARADEALNKDEEDGETEGEAEESDDNDEKPAGIDEESDNEDQPLEMTLLNEDDNDHEQGDLDFQVGQGLVYPPSLIGLHARGSHVYPPAYHYPNGLTGHPQQVRATARNEGHPSSITPPGNPMSYHPVHPNGSLASTLHPSYVHYLKHNNHGLLTLPGQQMGYLGHSPEKHTTSRFSQFPSGKKFIRNAKDTRGGNTSAGITHIHPALLNAGTSGAGGGSQSNTSCSRPAARRNRDSLEDNSEEDVDAPPRRRSRS